MSIAQDLKGIHHGAVMVNNIHEELPQEPDDSPGFWDMWVAFLVKYGFKPGDLIVASEKYGKELARHAQGKFMPFDIERALYPAKATYVRDSPYFEFEYMTPSFQKHIRKTVTIFGAESTGKTTLSRQLADRCNGHWTFEYARPYLETLGTAITLDKMHDIWRGQYALQGHAQHWDDKPFIFQDTDLFSTVGYWDYWSMNVPDTLVEDAQEMKSDLYLITKSNIPFERDPLRYGVTKREIQDDFWIAMCEKYQLPYKVIESDDRTEREQEGMFASMELFMETANELTNYVRRGKEYA